MRIFEFRCKTDVVQLLLMLESSDAQDHVLMRGMEVEMEEAMEVEMEGEMVVEMEGVMVVEMEGVMEG